MRYQNGNIGTYIIKSLFLIGLFFPTSIHGQILPVLEVASWVVLILLVSLFVLCTQKASILGASSALVIFLILITATFVSPFVNIAYGAILPFIGFGLLLTAKWREFETLLKGSTILFYVSIIMIIASILIIINNVFLTDTIKNYYSAFYPALLTIMLDWGRKPVLTFGTHSIAGFYFFIFFYLNFRTFECTSNRKFFIISLLFLILSLFLRSVTAYSFTAISLIYLFSQIYNRPKILGGIISGLVILCTGAVYFFGDLITFSQLIGTFDSEGNGFNGRYSSSSSLMPMLKYISENPLRPVGLSDSSEFFFGDSGLIILYLRGGLLLVTVFYGAFVLFLKNSLICNKDKVVLSLGFMLFELGFINLGYTRTIYVLPFIIVYLNSLNNMKKDEYYSIYGYKK